MDSINERFANFRAGCDDAPKGTFLAQRDLRDAIGSAVDSLMQKARELGLSPCNCDGAHHVEATIYAWMTEGSLFGVQAEGYGEYGGRLPIESDLRVAQSEPRCT